MERGVDPNKVQVVTNGVDLSRFKPRSKDPELLERFGLEGKFVAGYIGTHGLAHGLETILTAAELLQEAGDVGVHFFFLGDGARRKALEAEAERRGLANVTFIDSVAKADVVRYWSILDASIIHLRGDGLFKTVIPSKLFECMAMGIPILHGVAGESADIVRAEGVGLVFEPENANELVERIIRLRDDAGLYRSLRNRCLESAPRYGRKELAAEMLQMLRAAVSNPNQSVRQATERNL